MSRIDGTSDTKVVNADDLAVRPDDASEFQFTVGGDLVELTRGDVAKMLRLYIEDGEPVPSFTHDVTKADIADDEDGLRLFGQVEYDDAQLPVIVDGVVFSPEQTARLIALTALAALDVALYG